MRVLTLLTGGNVLKRMRFLAAALDRAGLPRIADAEAEARKVAVLRIVVGLLLAWRSGIVARDAVYYFDPTVIVGRRAAPSRTTHRLGRCARQERS